MNPHLPRYPLRAQHLEALRDALAIEGERKLARVFQCDAAELEQVATGAVIPTTLVRQQVIAYLVRSSLSKHRGDPYAPDGSEQWPSDVRRARRVHGVFELEGDDTESDSRVRSDRRFLQGLSALGKSGF